MFLLLLIPFYVCLVTESLQSQDPVRHSVTWKEQSMRKENFIRPLLLGGKGMAGNRWDMLQKINRILFAKNSRRIMATYVNIHQAFISE
jgi:hypothetical protein